MVTKLGLMIFNAAKKAAPIALNGTSKMAKNAKFSLKNPYILEAVPENAINSLNIFEGKKLKTVCRVLDSENSAQIMARYQKFCNRSAKGFSELEMRALTRKAFPNGKIPTCVNEDAFVYLNGLSEKIGSKFDAHGIAKISVTDQLWQLNSLLTKGIDKSKKFCTAPLVAPKGVGAGLGTSGGHAYRTGSFIIVSGKSKTLTESGIKHIIVNDAYYNIIDDLAARFPEVSFVRADKATEYFSKL